MKRLTKLLLILLFCAIGQANGEKLLFAQALWRHGFRTPVNSYSTDPYTAQFFGMPEGDLLPEGMRQHFIRGQQLRQIYVDEQHLVSAKYNRDEMYLRSSDEPRCSQSALANLAGFCDGSPTFPTGVANWPSAWTPIPIHMVPHEEDYIIESVEICDRFDQLLYDRLQQKGFQDFMKENRDLIDTLNAHSNGTESDSFWTIYRVYQALDVEKLCNLTLPDWVTDKFYNDLETAYLAGTDYMFGKAGFGLPTNQEMVKLASGFILNEWVNNIQSVIDGTSTLKYYAYSGHDNNIDLIMIGLGVKDEIIGPAGADFAATLICELWEKDQQYYIKLLYSDNIDSEFESFTRKLPGCDSDLCPLAVFQAFIQPYIAEDSKICNNALDRSFYQMFITLCCILQCCINWL